MGGGSRQYQDLTRTASTLAGSNSCMQTSQSMKPTVSSMMAAKLFVSLCFPLVMGGNWAIFVRNSSDFRIAGPKSLLETSVLTVITNTVRHTQHALSTDILTSPWHPRAPPGDYPTAPCSAQPPTAAHTLAPQESTQSRRVISPGLSTAGPI